MHDKNAEIRKVCDNTLDIIAVSINCFSVFVQTVNHIYGVMVVSSAEDSWFELRLGQNQDL
jgi:hypothetical protein